MPIQMHNRTQDYNNCRSHYRSCAASYHSRRLGTHAEGAVSGPAQSAGGPDGNTAPETVQRVSPPRQERTAY